MSSEDRSDELRALAGRLGIDIRDFALFDRALTHSSVSQDGPEGAGENYESLEFLGDAVLGLAVAHTLYEQAPGRGPGEYSQMRARVVNRHALAEVAKEVELAPAIRLGKGEEKTGGRQRAALLADCMEAVIGAVYLDRGWDAARECVERIFHTPLEKAYISTDTWDYRSRLQEYCQANRIPLPEFEVVRAEGPDHQKQFDVVVRLRETIVGRGTGSSKKEAEQNAAREALESEGQLLG